MVGLQAPLSFLNAENFRADVLERSASRTPKPKLLVLEASGILEIDFTAAQILLDLIRRMPRSKASRSRWPGWNRRGRSDAFERFGIYDVLPKDRIFHSVDEAVRALAGKP